MHEASLHERNCFLTLTYAVDPVSLDVDDLQRFFKRLRKSGLSVRYYACGEYGERLGRPHYHVLLFGEDFSFDRWHFYTNAKGFPIYRSPALERLWTAGTSEIGSVTFESASYAAGYTMKKINGAAVGDHYLRVDPVTGEAFKVSPEFAVMSRRPGIGHGWFQAFKREVMRDDSVIAKRESGNFESKPPRYYDGLAEREDGELFAANKRHRLEQAKKYAWNSTDERLSIRAAVAEARESLRGKKSYET